MRLVILDTSDAVSSYVAAYICQRISEYAPTADRPFVLGVQTGASLVQVYQNLVDYYHKGKVSFEHVVTFNTDEYVGLPRDHPSSTHSFMWNHLFKHVNIKPENVHILDGNAVDVGAECKQYEADILACRGIELFLVGVGEDGRMAYNEPGSSMVSRTRVKTLAQQTLISHARYFDDDVNAVPKLVLTVGVGTLMSSREMICVITGKHKAMALAKCVEEGVCQMWTASAVQLHQHATFVCDDDATLEMRVKTVRYFKGIQEVHGQVMQKQR